MIKNIIFDLGGVLIDFNPHATLRDTFGEADAALVYEVLFDTDLWKSLDLGVRSFSDIIEECCAVLPSRLHESLTDLLSNWWDYMPPFPVMPPLIQSLKDNGYHVYLCSNTPDEIYRRFDDIPALPMMDGIIASCDYGVAKPDHRIYEALYEKFNLNPAECFFIDDMPANLQGAAETGMQGYCFAEKDAEKLKVALREAGVEI